MEKTGIVGFKKNLIAYIIYTTVLYFLLSAPDPHYNHCRIKILSPMFNRSTAFQASSRQICYVINILDTTTILIELKFNPVW